MPSTKRGSSANGRYWHFIVRALTAISWIAVFYVAFRRFPSMFYRQCNKSCCGEKVLVSNVGIACKTQDIKAKRYVPVNVWRSLSHLNSLTLIALAYTSLSTQSLNFAACISCLDHKRLQSNKLRKGMIEGQHNSRHGRVVYFLRHPNHLSGTAYPE